MNKYIENSNLNLITTEEAKEINGGGPLRKYGEAIGDVVFSIAIKAAFALVFKRTLPKF